MVDAIKIENLSKVYKLKSGDKIALDNVSLSVKENSFFALLGPNGAGKSTMINILSSLVIKNSGKVIVNGFDLDLNLKNVKRSLGIVPQEIYFDPFFTAIEYLMINQGLFGVKPNRKSAMDYVNLLDQQADSMVKDYDKSKQKFANPYTNFSKFKPGSQEEVNGKIKYVAWENAVQDLVFQKDTYKHVIKRMGDILNNVKDNVGAALYNPFFTLTSTENIGREIAMLKEEISSIKLNPTLDAPARKILDQKEAQLKGLKRWSDSHSLIGSFLEKREKNQNITAHSIK
jgi:energy-coupling factor transporter ATP-binding protein EcfA2